MRSHSELLRLGHAPIALGLLMTCRATVEVMSEEEKDRRRREAREAKLRGDDAGVYWRDNPEIPTVGHFSSMAGTLAASYAIRWLTGKFTPTHRYLNSNSSHPILITWASMRRPAQGVIARR